MKEKEKEKIREAARKLNAAKLSLKSLEQAKKDLTEDDVSGDPPPKTIQKVIEISAKIDLAGGNISRLDENYNNVIDGCIENEEKELPELKAELKQKTEQCLKTAGEALGIAEKNLGAIGPLYANVARVLSRLCYAPNGVLLEGFKQVQLSKGEALSREDEITPLHQLRAKIQRLQNLDNKIIRESYREVIYKEALAGKF